MVSPFCLPPISLWNALHFLLWVRFHFRMGTAVSKRKNLRSDAISSVAAKVRWVSELNTRTDTGLRRAAGRPPLTLELWHACLSVEKSLLVKTRSPALDNLLLMFYTCRTPAAVTSKTSNLCHVAKKNSFGETQQFQSLQAASSPKICVKQQQQTYFCCCCFVVAGGSVLSCFIPFLLNSRSLSSVQFKIHTYICKQLKSIQLLCNSDPVGHESKIRENISFCGRQQIGSNLQTSVQNSLPEVREEVLFPLSEICTGQNVFGQFLSSGFVGL